MPCACSYGAPTAKVTRPEDKRVGHSERANQQNGPSIPVRRGVRGEELCIYIYMIISIINMNDHSIECAFSELRVRVMCDVPGLYSCARGDGLLVIN